MERKLLLISIIVMLLTSLVGVAFRVERVQASGTIYIRADGSIDPPTANITTVDNVTYIFTDNNYDEIVVERDNIILDGQGYILQGTGSEWGITLFGRSNITLKNIEINTFYIGVYLYSSSYNIVSGNTITNNHRGVYLHYSSNYNTVSGNNIINNGYGVYLSASSYNSLSGNTFNNTENSIYILSTDSTVLGHYMHSIDVSNLVDGKPVYYLINQTDIVINNATYPQIGYLALVNCANATVEGLTMTDYFLLAYTNNSRIIGNSGFCICVEYSLGNVISGNNITANNDYSFGVNLYNSSSNTLSENNVTNSNVGVILRRSSYNVLRNNHFNNNTMNFGNSVHSRKLSHFINDVDVSNTVDGKPIYYWVNRHNEQVPSDAGYVALVNSTNITVKELELKNNVQGVLLAYTTNSQIMINSIANNNIGVYLYESSFNNLSGNHVANNDFGIYTGFSNDNAVSGNNITNNGDGIDLASSSNNNTVSGNNITNSNLGVLLQSSSNYNTVSGNNITNNYSGIYLSTSSNNTIYRNNIINNTFQAYNYDSINNWDDGYPSCGNYWNDYAGVDLYSGPYQNETGSDGIGDTPYVIDENNTDTYPLMGPFSLLTMEGENVTVFPADDVGLIFGNVTSEGFTTVNKTETGPEPPSGFIVEQYYDIETTANYSGGITIRIIYDDSNMTQPEEEILQLMQWNDTTQQWVDITTHVDTESNLIFGETNHLSTFSITQSSPINYITITEVNLSKTVVGQGFTLDVNVTVTNQGENPQTINVTLYTNTTIIDAQENITLSDGESTVLVFLWDTAGFDMGNYTIRAEASAVQGESDLTDNALVAEGEVCVTIPGDVDADQDVDIFDIVAIAGAYGSTIGDPAYNPNYDIDGDRDIDIFDIVAAAVHYGDSW